MRADLTAKQSGPLGAEHTAHPLGWGGCIELAPPVTTWLSGQDRLHCVQYLPVTRRESMHTTKRALYLLVCIFGSFFLKLALL